MCIRDRIDTTTLITAGEETEDATAETVTAVQTEAEAVVEGLTIDVEEDGTVSAGLESEEISVEVEAPAALEVPAVEEAAPAPSN